MSERKKKIQTKTKPILGWDLVEDEYPQEVKDMTWIPRMLEILETFTPPPPIKVDTKTNVGLPQPKKEVKDV